MYEHNLLGTVYVQWVVEIVTYNYYRSLSRPPIGRTVPSEIYSSIIYLIGYNLLPLLVRPNTFDASTLRFYDEICLQVFNTTIRRTHICM
jgi:hypothetical protein